MKRPPVNSRNVSSRSGLSLTEVLVALAVVAVVMGIMLPAVQKARETARRINCASHLRQIMIAIQHYESVSGVFPGGDPGPLFHGRILDYLQTPSSAASNPLFVCPSDPLATGEWGKMRANYYSNKGSGSFTRDGFLGDGFKGVKPRDVRDGLSHTAAISERLAWPEFTGRDINWDEVPDLWIRRLRDTQTYHDRVDDFVVECRERALRPLMMAFFVPGYTHVLPPNENSCVNQSTLNQPIAVTSTSLHGNGVNLVFGDGSLRFIPNQIDLKIWWALGTRSGGEIIPEF